MALKLYNPTTPGQRGLILVKRDGLWKGKPEKSLVWGKSSSGGRNNNGRITSYKKSAGHKKKYRMIDFKRIKDDMPATVQRIEYDPNRTANIALIEYQDKTISYIISPNTLEVGQVITSGPSSDIKVGNCLPMKNIPVGTIVHNVEMKLAKGAQIARSAGSYAQIIGKDTNQILLRLRSGEVRVVPSVCRAVIGTVSNLDWQNVNFGKAGRNRWRGIKPTVRGVAMNPIDHPHGGGEGKTSGGRSGVTPWGVSTKGKRTRNNKRTSKYIIRRRNKSK